MNYDKAVTLNLKGCSQKLKVAESWVKVKNSNRLQAKLAERQLKAKHYKTKRSHFDEVDIEVYNVFYKLKRSHCYPRENICT